MESLGIGGMVMIAFLVLIILLVLYSVVFHKKRRDQILVEAPMLGLQTIEDEELRSRLGDVTDLMFPNGVKCELKDGEERRRLISTAVGGMSKNLASRPVTVFDLSLSSRYYNKKAAIASGNETQAESRRGGMTLLQTVVMIQLGDVQLPKFIIAERLSEEEEFVSVNGATQWGKHYHCCALDEDKARVAELMSADLLNLLESERLWSIECHVDRVFVYQKNWLTPAAKLNSLVSTADRVFKGLLKKTG